MISKLFKIFRKKQEPLFKVVTDGKVEMVTEAKLKKIMDQIFKDNF